MHSVIPLFDDEDCALPTSLFSSPPEMVPVAEMMLSGSRGIGSVAFNDIYTIDVFDLEEDEDDDEDEEDSDVE